MSEVRTTNVARWRVGWPQHQPSITDVAWVAGLIEGEGSFYLHNRARYPSVIFQLNMTDEDVVRRAHHLMGQVGVVNPHQPGPRSVKPQWRWRVGAQAEVAWLMELIYPFMGVRRSAKIDELRARLPEWIEGAA